MAKIETYPALLQSVLVGADQFVINDASGPNTTKNITVTELNKQWVTKSGNSTIAGSITITGSLTANELIGNGAKITGIAGVTGGVTNPGNTNIIADNNNDGSGAITLSIYTTDVLTVANNKKVGIGTAAPTLGKLDVLGDMAISFSGSDSYLYFQAATNYVGRKASTGDIWLNATNGTKVHLGINGSEILTCSGGNVGFGTSTPARLGHFKSTGSTEVRIESAVAGASALEFADTAVRWTIYKPSSTTDLRFYDGTADRVTILNGGNVGFGTTSPDVLGHIMNSDASALWQTDTYFAVENNGNCFIAIGSSTTGAGNILFSDSGKSGAGQISYNHSTDAMSFYTWTGAANVQGISINNAGAIQFPTGYGAGTITSDASGNLTAVSDVRYKNVIGHIEKGTGIKSLMGIVPIFHTYKECSGLETKGIYLGFSAQNVLKSIPSAIDTNNPDKLTLSDRPILAHAVVGLQEHEIEIQRLKKRIKQLEAA
jgi:hypothetical protein